MSQIALKIGEIAKQTGVSVRTLHYYDEIGLLSPSHRTEAGYRLYGETDIIRLQQIVSLRQIDLSLEEIRQCLEKADFSFSQVLQMHITRLHEQIELSQKLLTRLEAIAQTANSMEAVSAHELIQVIGVINMLEKYYTPKQLEILQQRQELLGEERMIQSQIDWQELIEQFQTEMEKGTDPKSELVQSLVRRRQELIDEFTGKDPEIEQSLTEMYEQGGSEVASLVAEDSALAEYLTQAMH
jgi:MerR family transcriptional regulator, thiopeptide resistance regulator